MQDIPLVLVIDLDETLVFVDEDNRLKKTNCCSMFYRAEMYDCFNYLRKNFKQNLYLVLWSTGDNSYVSEIVFRLNLHFDLILGRKESKESKHLYGVNKSVSYLSDYPCVAKWVNEKMIDPNVCSPRFAIIDDRAFENTSMDDLYDYTIKIDRITLSKITLSKNCVNYQANVDSLIRYAIYFVDECIYRNKNRIQISTGVNSIFINTFSIGFSQFNALSNKNNNLLYNSFQVKNGSYDM